VHEVRDGLHVTGPKRSTSRGGAILRVIGAGAVPSSPRMKSFRTGAAGRDRRLWLPDSYAEPLYGSRRDIAIAESSSTIPAMDRSQRRFDRLKVTNLKIFCCRGHFDGSTSATAVM